MCCVCSRCSTYVCTYMHCPVDNQYYMILVGYDGIAIAPLIFHHQSSLLAFLECVDSGLLPQGCLEPPVWFLKNQIGGECESESFEMRVMVDCNFLICRQYTRTVRTYVCTVWVFTTCRCPPLIGCFLPINIQTCVKLVFKGLHN